jgi:Polyketide cyclase / dehydrase and lipid transport
MPRSAIGTALAALLAFGPAQGAGAEEADLGWIDWSAVENGEVALQTATEEGTVTIDLAIEINAGWKPIWEVLTACEISPEYVPNVVDCKQLETIDDGKSELFLQTVKPAFFIPRFEHVFRLDYYPPERIDVRHVSGPIDVLDGSWRLLPRPNGTIALLYTVSINPGFPVPRFFVRNTLRRDLPGVLREVRARAENTARTGQ